MDLPAVLETNNHLQILRFIRTHKLLEPELVLQHGQALLSKKASSLTDSESLAVHEQVCIAALHMQQVDLANQMLGKISLTVEKSSTRFRRLLALCLEAEESWDDALAIYQDLSAKNPSNVYALKRIYCILKAQVGKEVEARVALNDYLERNGSDASAWMELAAVCASLGDYEGAAQAMEEVVLVSPLDSEVHCTLAEYYVTSGNYKAARKHFAQSLELNSKNLRAVYGLISAAEGYLESVEATAGNADGTGAEGEYTKSHKKNGKNKGRVVDEEDVELAKDLLKFGTDKLVKAYKGTAMSGLVTSVVVSQES